MAARAGAVIADPEFVQFHPTAFAVGRDPAPLATEALRGEGATLINAAGERFMLKIHPLAELAPRDIVARAVHAEIAAGRGAFLDCRDGDRRAFRRGVPDGLRLLPRRRHRSGARSRSRSRRPRTTTWAACSPTRTAAPRLDGLWACGETASTGAHGANRLASNSLLEAIVFGARVADDVAGRLPVPVAFAPVASEDATGRAILETDDVGASPPNHVGRMSA